MQFGDVVAVDFGNPIGSEAGFLRPAVVLAADALLRYWPTTVFVVPLTTTARRFPSHIEVTPDSGNGLDATSYGQVEQMRAVSIERCSAATGNVGPAVGHQMLDVLAMILGMP